MNRDTEQPSFLPLSVLIITHRSDERFEKALASVQFAEEILVFDDESDADWDKLAENFRFRVIPVKEGFTDFSAIRNYAVNHASHHWVLFLDSDERLQLEAPSQIAKILLDNLYEGVFVKRSDIFLGKKLKFGEAGTTYLIRLARKRQLKYEGKVHEVPIIPGSIGQSDIEILHYSHNSISEFITDISEYAQSVAEEKTTGFLANILELMLFPVGKFFINYFLKFGFLDGWRGLTYATMMSLHSLFVRMYRLQILVGIKMNKGNEKKVIA